MPRFEPFQAIRYADSANWPQVIAPPYDVLSDADVTELQRAAHNIVWVDVPKGEENRYRLAADRLAEWLAAGILITDQAPAFYIYRMTMVDSYGQTRQISGVLGGLEVVDAGAGGVLPHERTTTKDSTDRLELMKATAANTSPVWGLSLAEGLTEVLADPGELIGEYQDDGVIHRLEAITDTDRIAQIRATIGSDDVLIADGHHRYGVSRKYRDLVRQTGREDSEAELTLTFINELSEDQLAIEAIHRIYRGISYDQLQTDLADCFTFEEIGHAPTAETLAQMVSLGRLVLLGPDGQAEWLIPKPGVFDQVRALDGAWLEHALATSQAEVSYQHGLAEILHLLSADGLDDPVTAAILIRPTSITEIIRTARQGELMPPKSTFFTPKLRTGLVVRPTTALAEPQNR